MEQPETMTALGVNTVMLEAGFDLEAFSDAFEDCSDPQEADQAGRALTTWMQVHHPEHPLGRLRIVHIETALRDAGINPRGSFSAESYAADRRARRGVDARRWTMWLKEAQALHACDWHDAGTVTRDVAKALDCRAKILVLQRLG